jgi:hypothetical protein
VRQRGAQGGEEEPVERNDDQGGRVEGGAGHAAEDLSRDYYQAHRPEHVGKDEHVAAPPTIEQHAGKGPDHRVWQEQNGEGGSDVRCSGLLLGVEQDGTSEAGLEHAVAELTEQAGCQQPAEPGVRERGEQMSPSGHGLHAIGLAPAMTCGDDMC